MRQESQTQKILEPKSLKSGFQHFLCVKEIFPI
jgi:hypothetical protein